jgi:hypothetical protein
MENYLIGAITFAVGTLWGAAIAAMGFKKEKQ